MSEQTAEQMLPREEYLDITLLCMMEIMGNVLAARAKPKSYRANRIELFQKEMERVAHTYRGRVPEVFANSADHLYKTVEAGINYLLANHGEETKYEIVPENEAAKEITA